MRHGQGFHGREEALAKSAMRHGDFVELFSPVFKAPRAKVEMIYLHGAQVLWSSLVLFMALVIWVSLGTVHGVSNTVSLGALHGHVGSFVVSLGAVRCASDVGFFGHCLWC